ncbi:hypothetical protein BX666DRAFT_605763 [Dichotomocladium elegans]|nr:hypothetical protein BX666DRAFT_605763 [Dichotomocladium elegans]
MATTSPRFCFLTKTMLLLYLPLLSTHVCTLVFCKQILNAIPCYYERVSAFLNVSRIWHISQIYGKSRDFEAQCDIDHGDP